MTSKLFPNVIQLKINKRVDPEDREKLESVLHDLHEAKDNKAVLANLIRVFSLYILGHLFLYTK